MLDNMSLAEMRQAVAAAGGRVELEASGNVTLDRVAGIAATGVDYMSVGALTHSVRALDLSMEVGAPDKFEAPPDLPDRIAQLKSALAAQTMILGHHYQRDDVLAFADVRGDSLKLARDAVQTEKHFIVFCGVHFMAETSAILARPGQRVLIPDPAAGCYLADTATPEEVQAAWEHLEEVFGDAETEFTPITYVNSSAALKAFCGQRGGIVCTSGNAEGVVRWSLQRRPRVFFFPDQHLGRNTCKRMGIPLEDMLLWSNRRAPDADAVRGARVILWPGACNVHQRFRAEHVHAARQRSPSIRVLVHPECRTEVVDLADDVGSTAHIIQAVADSPPGTQWAIGTESRLVQRLQQQRPDQRIVSLAQVPPFCRTMSMITLPKLAEVLEALADDRIINEVTVDPETAHWARTALERMLEIG